MREPSGTRHELLQRVLTGELPENAPEVLEWIGRDPEAHEELELLLAGRDRSDAAARFEDEVLEAAGAIEGAPGEDQVEAFVEARMDQLGSRSTTPRHRRLAILLAVAASVLLLTWWRTPRLDVPLGGDEVEWISPQDRAARESLRFEWKPEEAERWEFEVVVRGVGMDERRSRRSRNTWWEPEETDTWPGRIEWELLGFDSSGREVRLGQGSVEFSSE